MQQHPPPLVTNHNTTSVFFWNPLEAVVQALAEQQPFAWQPGDVYDSGCAQHEQVFEVVLFGDLMGSKAAIAA